MQSWEYMTLERSVPMAGNEHDWQRLQRDLNNLGMLGWELVGFVATERGNATSLIYTFKRPVTSS